MILERTRLHGFPCEHDGQKAVLSLEVDWSALGPGIIALEGPNGSGKSSLLEASGPAALFRTFPYSADSFLDHVAPTVRDAQLELTFALDGQRLRVLLQGDPQANGGRGRSEAYLSLWCAPVDGAEGIWQPLAGPLVRDYDEAIARRLPRPALFYASVFAAQPSRYAPPGFFGMPPAARKDLFVRMLACEQWQEWSTRAGDEADAARHALGLVMQDVEQVRRAALRAEDLGGRLAEATTQEAPAEAAAAAALDRLTKARGAHAAAREDLAGQMAAARAVLGRNRERRQQAEAAAADVARLEHDLAGLQMVADAVTTIREAAAALPQREADLETARAAADVARAVLAPLEADIPIVRAELAQLRTDHERLRTSWTRRSEELRRRGGLLGELEEPTNPLCQRCPLTADARMAASTLALEATTQADALAGNVQAGKHAREVLDALEQRRSEASAALGRAEGHVATAREQHRACAAIARRAPELEAALARRDALLPQLAAARAASFQVGLEPEPDLRAAEEKVGLAHAEVIDADHDRDVTTAQLERIRTERARIGGELAAVAEQAARTPALEADRARIETAIADWRIVEAACGRDGVQALEIDQAGPTVSALCNDLLYTCFGGRFALALETTAALASGKGTKEVFEARLLDRGRPLRLGSGGEMVIVEEALRLAIALFNARRGGIPLQTLYRDESGAPLDAENAQRYLDMLRRARELGRFHQVLVISHDQAVWPRADARVHLGNGGVRID